MTDTSISQTNEKLIKERSEQSGRERGLITDVEMGFKGLNPPRWNGVRFADLYIGSC